MLVLTRKLREKVLIGNSIRVMVVAIEGGRIRLGFEAPREVAIHREEIISKRNGQPAA